MRAGAGSIIQPGQGALSRATIWVMPDVGRIMILVGLGIAALGVLIVIGLPLFRLPGDIVIKGEHAVLIIPIATCIVLSIVLTIAFSLLARR